MGYVTNAQIESRLGTAVYVQLTDDAGSGVADAAKVDEARAAAEAEVDSYLARRVRVPIDLTRHPELGGLLGGLVLDLAAYRLHSRRPPVPADVVRRRTEAIAWLERAARGDVVLPATTPVDPNDTTGIAGTAVGAARELSRETMREL